MERHPMRVIGFGLRPSASRQALEHVFAHALDKISSHNGLSAVADCLATLSKRADHPAFQALAQAHGLPVIAVEETAVAGIKTHTRSARIEALFGTGSIAEATALLAAGDGARIIVSRIVSPDGTASAAVAETEGLTGI
jgi:cobalt-precorrin 5A hydrolase